VQNQLRELAARAAARARPTPDGQEHVVWELRGGESPVLVVESQSGEELVVKIVQATRGQLATCPAAFPPQAANILPVLDVFAWANGYGIVMPLAEMSLRQWLKNEDDSCTLDALLAVLTDVARALASIEGSMVHGDLKPENILRHEGRWCLADFGPSACPQSLSERGEYSLTPAYAAPEQWRGLPVTGRTDIYAFGVIAFELLNGVRPFPGPTKEDLRRQHLSRTAPRLLGMPASLTRLIATCLVKSPADRPTAAEVLALLETHLGDGVSSTLAEGWSAREDDWPTTNTVTLLSDDSAYFE
jgi:eukaryotic-like serine/threonine-protein kinase